MKIQVVSLGCLELNHDKINRLVILSIGEIQPRLLGTKKHNYPLIARKIDLAETSDVLVINKCPFHGRSPCVLTLAARAPTEWSRRRNVMGVALPALVMCCFKPQQAFSR